MKPAETFVLTRDTGVIAPPLSASGDAETTGFWRSNRRFVTPMGFKRLFMMGRLDFGLVRSDRYRRVFPRFPRLQLAIEKETTPC